MRLSNEYTTFNWALACFVNRYFGQTSNFPFVRLCYCTIVIYNIILYTNKRHKNEIYIRYIILWLDSARYSMLIKNVLNMLTLPYGSQIQDCENKNPDGNKMHILLPFTKAKTNRV